MEGRRDRWKLLGIGGAALVLAGGLASCTSTEDVTGTDQTSTATPSASATLSERQQQIAAAEKALRDYEAASIEASRDLNADTLTLMRLVTPEWWSENEVPALNRSSELKEVSIGDSELVTIRPVRVSLHGPKKSIKFRVCKDVTDIRYVKAEGKDKGKIVYNPLEEGTPRFEMTYTFVYSEKLDQWRLASYRVPLDERGESTPC